METLSRIPSVLGNPTDRGAWWAIAIGSQKSWPQLSTHTHNQFCSEGFASTDCDPRNLTSTLCYRCEHGAWRGCQSLHLDARAAGGRVVRCWSPQVVIPSAQLGIPGRQLEGPHLCLQKCTESQLLHERERERDSPSPPVPESQKENRK